MRLGLQRRVQNSRQKPSTLIQWTQFDRAIVGHDLQRRAIGCDIPARIPPGILVSRGKVNPTMTIQIAKNVFEALAEVSLGGLAGDLDPVGGRIAVFAHRFAPWVSLRIACVAGWPRPCAPRPSN